MIKYEEEFCEIDGYRCLMPIEYELIKETVAKKTYKKVKCNCHNVIEGKCDKGTECKHFLIANEIIEE
jgi:hypothetical protein